MRNNKGFSLVEFLVAMAVLAIVIAEIGMIMTNSSKLYKKGTEEIDLQSESQRVLQFIEELMVDADVEIRKTSCSVAGSDNFDVVRHDTYADKSANTTAKVYRFRFVKNDPSKDYGKLFVSCDGSADVILSDYVSALVFDDSAYANDKITVGISMSNGTNTYGSASNPVSKVVYLRNKIGSGGVSMPALNDEKQYKLEVLRFEDADLNKAFAGWGKKTASDGVSYTLTFIPPIGQSNAYCEKFYHLNAGNMKISPSNLLNQSFNTNTDFNLDPDAGSKQIMVEANDGAESFRFVVYTVPVEIGLSESFTVRQGDVCPEFSPEYKRKGEQYVFASTDISTTWFNAVDVKGISLKPSAISGNPSATDYSAAASNMSGTWELYESSGGAPNKSGILDYATDTNTMEYNGHPNLKIENLRYSFDPNTNIIMFNFRRFMEAAEYGTAITASGGYIKYNVIIKYPTSSGDAELELTTYCAPVGRNGGSVYNIADDFWEIINK